MGQLGFDSAPAVDTPVDFSAITPGGRVEVVEHAQRLHKNSFKPVNPDSRRSSRAVVYRVKPGELPAEDAPARPQTLVASSPMLVVSQARIDARVREARALQALSLDGAAVIQPFAPVARPEVAGDALRWVGIHPEHDAAGEVKVLRLCSECLSLAESCLMVVSVEDAPEFTDCFCA